MRGTQSPFLTSDRFAPAEAHNIYSQQGSIDSFRSGVEFTILGHNLKIISTDFSHFYQFAFYAEFPCAFAVASTSSKLLRIAGFRVA